MLETFSAGTFSPHLNTNFTVYPDPANPVSMELIKVTEIATTSARTWAGEKRLPFSLLFRGPAGAVLPQQIYRMQHDALGEFELFIVPVGRNADGVQYEAVFT